DEGLVLGDRGPDGADRGDLVRPHGGADGGGHRLSPRHACVLRGVVATQGKACCCHDMISSEPHSQTVILRCPSAARASKDERPQPGPHPSRRATRAPQGDGSEVCPLLAFSVVLLFATAVHAQAPMPSTKIQLVPFDVSPFPYSGPVPDKNVTFLDVVNGERRGHTSGRGGVYWEDLTYSDRRTLLAMPRGFDIRRPAVIVVYFHGNQATLTR